MVQKAWKLTIPLFLLSFCGAYVSFRLFEKHVLGTSGPAWFAAVCGDEASADKADAGSASERDEPAAEKAEQATGESVGQSGGGDHCAVVLASRWATIPPSPEEEEQESIGTPVPKTEEFRVPTAYLGLIYFISLTVWFLFVGRPTPDRREWYRIPLVFVIGGVCSSLFFMFIMFTQTDEWCPWCLLTHVINFLILAGMIMLRPQAHVPVVATPQPFVADRSTSAPEPVTDGEQRGGTEEPGEAAALTVGTEPVMPAVAAPEAVHPHPSLRLAGACILLSAAACAMIWNGLAVQHSQQETAVVKEKLGSFEKDTGFLAAMYDRQPQVKIPIRSDDPITGKQDDIFLNLVVFSDFQCPFCAELARVVKGGLQSLFNQSLRVIWKHYPLCTDCNDNVKYNTHKQACQAARAAEAARLQGGNEAFWKAHDVLFNARRRLEGFDYTAMAEELGLDPVRFVEDMNSKAVTDRIAEDIAVAKSVGVKSTPAVFLSGRRVDSKILRIQPFWQAMAERFYRYRESRIREQEKRQKQAKLPKATDAQPTTQDTPSRSDAE